MGYLEREIVLESDGVLPALISRRTHIRGAMLRGDIVRVFFSPPRFPAA
ncbi:unknown [Prevotella sp. CAG:1320]|nr:unknown [Prevotella sp. CAG:1320]